MAIMVKYTTDIKKLFHEGITKAEDNGILPKRLKSIFFHSVSLLHYLFFFFIILFYYSSVLFFFIVILYYYCYFTNCYTDTLNRWNIIYITIKAALEVRELLTYVYRNTDNKKYDKIFLSLAEWITLKHLEKVFKVLVQPIIRLQSEYYTNINKGLLFIHLIFNKLEALAEKFEALSVEESDLVSLVLLFFINIILYYYLYRYYLLFTNIVIGGVV